MNGFIICLRSMAVATVCIGLAALASASPPVAPTEALSPSILNMMADSSGGAIPAANIVSLALKVAEQLRMAALSGQTLGVLANSKLPDDVRTTAADIDEVAVSHLSPMASNMLDQVGEKNLPDLLAYLMQQAARP